MKKVEFNTNYDVVANKNVTLTIIIGNEQIGGSVALLNGQELARGDIKDILVGKGDDIKNLKLKIKSAVTDVNDSTDVTTITYSLKGGKIDHEYNLSGTSEGNGTVVAYISEFVFTI